MEIDVTDNGSPDAPPTPGRDTTGRYTPSRRAILGIGVGGAAVSLLPVLGGRAGAATPSTDPPKRPTDADVVLLAEAQQLEVTAVALYDEAIAAGSWSDEQAALMVFIRGAHLAYAQAFSGMLGRQAPGTKSETLFNALRSDFTGDVDNILGAAFLLESAAVATHTEVLGSLEGTDGAALVSSMLLNEARFGTALADLAGETDLSLLLVDTEEPSLVGQG